MSEQRLEGHVVLVTGALGTLGSAMCTAIEAAGGTAIRSDLAGRGKVDIALDVTSEQDWVAAMAAIARQHGRLDGLVNNAGIGTPGDVEQTSYADWRRVMAVNADGAFHVLRRGLAAMLDGRGGAIVNTSSSTGLAGKPNMTPYSFSKAGLVGLTRAAAIEYAAHGIRVNAIAPTAVMTDLVAGHIARAPDPDAMRRLLETQTPIPGMPTPEDVAAVVAFLASDDARWITGHTLPIDGGFHAQ
jgi:NAD(P)-dependent dehydrogenase (short-subunit alcohol dehydrogenase family)